MTPAAPEEDLSAVETADLRVVAGHIVPASAELGVPGADDAKIFADIVASLGRDRGAVKQALGLIAELAGERLSNVGAQDCEAVLASFRAAHPAAANTLYLVVVQCYYRDDRVMASIGMDVRPPFPKGFEIPQGDLSLLEPVRARGKAYRDAP